jgi:hypothetical protein
MKVHSPEMMMATWNMIQETKEKEGNLIFYIVIVIRLLQNRKSAKKCRLKKKQEFNVMKKEVM